MSIERISRIYSTEKLGEYFARLLPILRNFELRKLSRNLSSDSWLRNYISIFAAIVIVTVERTVSMKAGGTQVNIK